MKIGKLYKLYKYRHPLDRTQRRNGLFLEVVMYLGLKKLSQKPQTQVVIYKLLMSDGTIGNWTGTHHSLEPLDKNDIRTGKII